MQTSRHKQKVKAFETNQEEANPSMEHNKKTKKQKVKLKSK